MLGFITSIIKLNSDVLMRCIVLIFQYKQPVTIHDFDKLQVSYYYGTIWQGLSLFVVGYLINRDEYYPLQALIDKVDKMTPEQLKELDAQEKADYFEKKRDRRENYINKRAGVESLELQTPAEVEICETPSQRRATFYKQHFDFSDDLDETKEFAES